MSICLSLQEATDQSQGSRLTTFYLKQAGNLILIRLERIHLERLLVITCTSRRMMQ